MSLCNYPSLSIPVPTIDPMVIILAILSFLNLTIPPMPSIPMPAPFCALD